jgi:ribosomal subunit interface protein
MRIITKVRHTEIDQDTRGYAQRKVSTKLGHYLDENDDSILCEVEFDDELGPKGGNDKRVDLTITLPHQRLPLHIEEVDSTFREAIDRAVDRLDQPLERYKETQKHL